MDAIKKDIEDVLPFVGDDSIKQLYVFVTAWNQTAINRGDLIDKVMSERMLLELCEAIFLYSRWKDQ